MRGRLNDRGDSLARSVARLCYRSLPRSIRQRFGLYAKYAAAKSSADLASFIGLLRLDRRYRKRRWDGDPVSVRIRQLGGRPIWIRPGTTDVIVAYRTFVGGLHLPPMELQGQELKTILDLGAYIGVTTAHFAERFPAARVLGVELDSGNAAIARRNVAAWADRARIRHGAVWSDEGTVSYVGARGEEYGFRIARDSDTETWSAPAFSLSSLIRELAGPGGVVDYVKMDVEGAEEQLLQLPGWSLSVGAIKVEVHQPYTLERCLIDLRQLGFSARLDQECATCVIGIMAEKL